jgi:hypothetical protein
MKKNMATYKDEFDYHEAMERFEMREALLKDIKTYNKSRLKSYTQRSHWEYPTDWKEAYFYSTLAILDLSKRVRQLEKLIN